MRLRRGHVALRTLIAALAVVIPAAPASASECTPVKGLTGCVDSDNLWLSAGASPFLSLGPSVTTPALQYSFGLGLSYLSRPIGLRVSSVDTKGTAVYLVDNVLDATFLWSLGITDKLDLHLAAPLTLYQDGAGLYSVLGGSAELPRAGMRDVRFGFDYAFLPHPRTGGGRGFGAEGARARPAAPSWTDGFALLGRSQFALPTGVKDGFAGSRTVTWAPSILGELRVSRATITAEVGARIRGPASFAEKQVGTQMTGALGASFVILPGYLSASAEAFALVGVDTQPPPARLRDEYSEGPLLAPAEWMVSVSSAPALGGDLQAIVAGGGPIPLADEPALTNPRFRFSVSLKYAPQGRDTDADGVLDRDDQCPSVPEDRDGFQDDDGCPELDNDGDRIPDDRDRCRDAAETVDGFQDDDGCPDLDDDDDGIPDDVDQCRNEKEDKDSFQDDDGCPDPDNDGDTIPDASDLCPNGAEDRDGFRDADGCPDPDNDGDTILDNADLCPSAAEDKDGFQDDDGCPDPDNDQDGILDGADQCPTAAETIDGNADADGCPEPGAKSLVRWQGNQAFADPPAVFPRGSAKPSADSDKRLAMLAQLVRGASPVVVIIEAYADRQGDRSAKAAELADKRALAVKAAFVAAGISGDIVQAASGDPTVKRPAGASSFDVTVQRPKPKVPKKPATPTEPATEKR